MKKLHDRKPVGGFYQHTDLKFLQMCKRVGLADRDITSLSGRWIARLTIANHISHQ
jgi:hypothetical protein